ncbi:hypothetical protein FPQ18DRAFT_393597 [Pyronema domesticum]|nr:hypothetical protein FPQ18DRAFT_393597 [Pyronema domesticum]
MELSKKPVLQADGSYSLEDQSNDRKNAQKVQEWLEAVRKWMLEKRMNEKASENMKGLVYLRQEIVDRCFEDAVKQAPQRCFMIQYNHNSDEFDKDMALFTALGLFRPPKKSPEEAVEKSDGGPEVPAMWEHLKRGQPLNPKFVAILNNLGIRHSTQTGEESDGFKKPSLHYAPKCLQPLLGLLTLIRKPEVIDVNERPCDDIDSSGDEDIQEEIDKWMESKEDKESIPLLPGEVEEEASTHPTTNVVTDDPCPHPTAHDVQENLCPSLTDDEVENESNTTPTTDVIEDEANKSLATDALGDDADTPPPAGRIEDGHIAYLIEDEVQDGALSSLSEPLSSEYEESIHWSIKNNYETEALGQALGLSETVYITTKELVMWIWSYFVHEIREYLWALEITIGEEVIPGLKEITLPSVAKDVEIPIRNDGDPPGDGSANKTDSDATE